MRPWIPVPSNRLCGGARLRLYLRKRSRVLVNGIAALLIRTSRGPYRRCTRLAPATPLPSSVTSIRKYPAPGPSEVGCPTAASRAAEQGGMAVGEKRAGRLAAEPLLAPVIRVTGAEATSYSMTP
jgi:hypothetical protein